jgi:hypothetical protein
MNQILATYIRAANDAVGPVDELWNGLCAFSIPAIIRALRPALLRAAEPNTGLHALVQLQAEPMKQILATYIRAANDAVGPVDELWNGLCAFSIPAIIQAVRPALEKAAKPNTGLHALVQLQAEPMNQILATYIRAANDAVGPVDELWNGLCAFNIPAIIEAVRPALEKAAEPNTGLHAVVQNFGFQAKLSSILSVIKAILSVIKSFPTLASFIFFGFCQLALLPTIFQLVQGHAPIAAPIAGVLAFGSLCSCAAFDFFSALLSSAKPPSYQPLFKPVKAALVTMIGAAAGFACGSLIDKVTTVSALAFLKCCVVFHASH